MNVENTTPDSGFSSISDYAPVFTPELLVKNQNSKCYAKNSLRKKLQQMKRSETTKSQENVFVTDEEHSSGSSDSTNQKSGGGTTSSADSLSSSLESVGANHRKSISSNEDKPTIVLNSDTSSICSENTELKKSPFGNLSAFKSKKRNIPAPLALPEDSTSQCASMNSVELKDLRTRKISAPPPRSCDESGSPPTTPTKRLGRYMKAKFKLPPPLRLMKKKQSCPSFLENFNNSDMPWGAVEPAPREISAIIKNQLSPDTDTATNTPRSAKGKCQFYFPNTEEEAALLISNGGIPGTLTPPATGTSKSQSCPSFANAAANSGTRYKLIKDGQIQICKLNHPRSVVGKLSSSKLLRRWETHHLFLEKDVMCSTTPTGFMESPVNYAHIDDLHVLPHFDANDKYCIRIYVQEGSILLQTNHSYSRNQWVHSVQWRRSMMRYRKLLENTSRPEIILKELKCMVEQAAETPLQDDCVYLEPVQVVCKIMKDIYDRRLPRTLMEPVIICVSPLLETVSAVAEICPWLSKYCRDSPRSRLISDVFLNIVHETLKKNMDYGKFPSARNFVQCILLALAAQNDGLQRVRKFIQRVHGLPSACPHPRVLPNLVSACLAAIHGIFDPNGTSGLSVLSALQEQPLPEDVMPVNCGPADQSFNSTERLQCFCAALNAVSEFEDWRQSLASILQPLPFPESAFQNETFSIFLKRILYRLAQDSRCEVHTAVLGLREGKEGWFQLYCPGGPACTDNGELFTQMLDALLHCCCKRKKFLQSLNGMLGPLQLLALREKESAMEALCYMLEFEVIEGEDLKVQMITALQSTTSGKKHYAELCDRQTALKELQQKGGPRKLTLPSRSTDSDLAVLLSSGSFGNLEWLSLAFTNVTSNCADCLIKLPSLRYLNLWSTQFGDLGVQLISEHLQKLQVLNLCETPVSDKGLICLGALKHLRKLNLNSTHLSADTFQQLRENLPALQEVDLRYTEAWCADETLS